MLLLILSSLLIGNLIGHFVGEPDRSFAFYGLFATILLGSGLFQVKRWLAASCLAHQVACLCLSFFFGFYSLGRSWPPCNLVSEGGMVSVSQSGLPGPVFLLKSEKQGACKVQRMRAYPGQGMPKPTEGLSPGKVPAIVALSATLRGLILKRTALPGRDLSCWLRALLLGIFPKPGSALTRACRDLGLIHLLVVSGLHISLIFKIVSILVGLPFRVLYGARLIGPGVWIACHAFLAVVLSFSAVVYVLICQGNVAAQRAGMACAVGQLSLIIWGKPGLWKRICLTMILQLLLWPLSFCSYSTLVSWLSWGLVVYCGSACSGRPALGDLLVLQLCLTLLTAAVWGGLSLSGIMANIMVVPLMPAVLMAATLLIVGSSLPDWFQFALEAFLKSVPEFLIFVSERLSRVSGMYYDIRELVFVRLAFVVLFFAILFKYHEKKTIGASRTCIPEAGATDAKIMGRQENSGC